MVFVKVNYDVSSPIVKVIYDESPIYIKTNTESKYIKVTYQNDDVTNIIKYDDESGAVIKVNYQTTPIYIKTNVSATYIKVNYNNVSGAAGGVTSVGLTMPSAFSVANSPITSSGTLAVTGSGNSGQYIDGTGSLQTFPTSFEASDVIIEVRNNTGSTLTRGTVVYINGALGNKLTVAKAIATGDSTSAQTLGVLRDDIANNTQGYVVVIGLVENLDTSAYVEGTQLYLSGTIAGGYTSVKPYAPTHLVYVGIVTRQHPNLGSIEVKVQNGYELEELHNVAAQSPSNGDLLQYVSSTDLWTKTSVLDFGVWA